MLPNTIYKMSNASCCYPIAKSRQDHQRSQSEQLLTLTTFEGEDSVPSNHRPRVGLRHSAVKGYELSDFAIIL